jgi:hypothetical protein
VNSNLYGNQYQIPNPQFENLKKYAGEETIDNLLSTKTISYSNLKKIKNRMENGEKDKLGGDSFYSWVDGMLKSKRGEIDTSNKAKHEAGVSNVYIKQHKKDNVSNLNRPSKSHHRHNDEIRINETLKRINEIISKII